MQRLCKIPGIGPLTAHAIVAAMGGALIQRAILQLGRD
jgi:Holliday junction resolvasome RuvABC DNA-binding subunit